MTTNTNAEKRERPFDKSFTRKKNRAPHADLEVGRAQPGPAGPAPCTCLKKLPALICMHLGATSAPTDLTVDEFLTGGKLLFWSSFSSYLVFSTLSSIQAVMGDRPAPAARSRVSIPSVRRERSGMWNIFKKINKDGKVKAFCFFRWLDVQRCGQLNYSDGTLRQWRLEHHFLCRSERSV